MSDRNPNLAARLRFRRSACTSQTPNGPRLAYFTSFLCSASAALCLSWTPEAQAQEEEAPARVNEAAPDETPSLQLGESYKGLPGFIRLGAPVPASNIVSATGQVQYGNYASVTADTGSSHQYTGQLGLAVTPIKYVAARFSLRGDFNRHVVDSDDNYSDFYGEPELAVRAQYGWGKTYFGAEAEVRVVGTDAPDINWGSTTPTFRALFAHQLFSSTWLGAQLGYRIDNTWRSLENIERLQTGDRLVFHASSFDALEMGLAAAHRLGDWELLGEVSADILLGKDAPSFVHGPISLGLGARYDLLPSLNLRGHFEYSPSTQVSPFPRDVLIATRPRFSVGLGLTFRIGQSEAKPKTASQATSTPAVEKAPPPPPPVVVPDQGRLVGRVQDEGARPLSDVQVIVARADGEGAPQELYTDANGEFVFPELLTGPIEVKVVTPGYDSITKKVEIIKDGEAELEYTMYESLPAGQVKGRVLDLSGKPLMATVTVAPGDEAVPVSEDGSFSVDLKPGKYQVRFSLEGYTPQLRVVRVQDKGVVVLNIALER